MRNLICFLIVICAFGQNSSVSQDTVVLTVHGRQYTRAEFDQIVKAQNGDPRDVAAVVANGHSFARTLALAEEARRRKLDRTPAVRAKLEIYEAAVLNQALFNEILEEIHKDESLARQRLESRQHFAEERQLRQILVRDTESRPVAGKLTPDQALSKAQALRKKILAGAGFAEVAKAESDNAPLRAEGGAMNFVRKPLLLPEFGEAAFRLKLGEVSEPVKTPEGYYLILVEKIAPPAFEAVRKSIEFELARERMAAMTVSGVQMNAEYFGK